MASKIEQIISNHIMLWEMKKNLISPKMTLEKCSGLSESSFNLRSLNQNLVAKVRKR